MIEANLKNKVKDFGAEVTALEKKIKVSSSARKEQNNVLMPREFLKYLEKEMSTAQK